MTQEYTPSEQKVIDRIKSMPNRKILEITRSRGGDLIISFDRTDIRKSDIHESPFKYRMEWYGNRGGFLGYRAGNMLDEDGITILDDWTESFQSHRNGYSNK